MQRGLLAFIARAEVPTDSAGKARWELVETLKEGRRLLGGRRTSLGFRSTTWGGRGASTLPRFNGDCDGRVPRNLTALPFSSVPKAKAAPIKPMVGAPASCH